ncbi:MAG: transposase [Anaerovibrio sp.]
MSLCNRNRARIKVARLQERIVNIRKDFLHKESTKLVRENQLIAVENRKWTSAQGTKNILPLGIGSVKGN